MTMKLRTLDFITIAAVAILTALLLAMILFGGCGCANPIPYM